MKYLILLLLFASTLANEDETLGRSEVNPASSCEEIYEHNPTSRGTVGHYWIKTNEGLFYVVCNMELKCGGTKGGWMQVVKVDMNHDKDCPGMWRTIFTPKKLCLGSIAAGCTSAYFSTRGFSYDHICGQAKGIQKGTTDAFHSNVHSIDSVYVDGVSLTSGSPRKHIWTLAVGYSDGFDSPTNCPCATHPGHNPPAFVGNDYYCESGNTVKAHKMYYYLSDPLWDGSGCGKSNGCCVSIGMPWFYRKLPVSAAEDFEIRICKDQKHSDENIALEKLKFM